MLPNLHLRPATIERRRAFLPLICTSLPPLLQFDSGVRIADLQEEERPDLSTWDEILGKKEIRDFARVHRWFVYDYSAEEDRQFADSVIADAYIALQVAGPVGSHDFTSVFQAENSPFPTLSITRRSPLHSTGWARMVGYGNMSAEAIRHVVNVLTNALRTNLVRLANPIRFLENGLYSTNTYLRTMLWVTGLDSLMMAVNEKVFVYRLCNFLGADTDVFPPVERIIGRACTVGSVAADLFQLRSEIAHGARISRKFWIRLDGISLAASETAYHGMRTYTEVLEEASLILLCTALRKIVLRDLIGLFISERSWKAFLSRPFL